MESVAYQEIEEETTSQKPSLMERIWKKIRNILQIFV